MKLVHVDISKQMNFEQSSNFILAIENSQEFYRLSSQLISQCRGEQGDFAIYDGQLLDIPKTCIVIHDFYSDWFASKKTTSALQSQIIDLLKNNDFIEDFAALNHLIGKINEKICEKTDYPISSIDEIGYEHFTKMLGYTVANSPSLAENVLSYVQLCATPKLKIVAFVGLSDVLPQNQVQSLLKMLNYMQLNVVLIESHVKYKLDECDTIIIDDDLCVI